jgi:hypothetical protein
MNNISITKIMYGMVKGRELSVLGTRSGNIYDSFLFLTCKQEVFARILPFYY